MCQVCGGHRRKPLSRYSLLTRHVRAHDTYLANDRLLRNTFAGRTLTIRVRRQKKTQKNNPKTMRGMREKICVVQGMRRRRLRSTPISPAVHYGYCYRSSGTILPRLAVAATTAAAAAYHWQCTKKSVLFSYWRFNSIRTLWAAAYPLQLFLFAIPISFFPRLQLVPSMNTKWPETHVLTIVRSTKRTRKTRRRKRRRGTKILIEFVAAGDTFTNERMKRARNMIWNLWSCFIRR